MASVYPQFKNGKIVSFKFKAFLGRDENGKQQFKCKTWIPAVHLSEKKLKQQAEKEAVIWEREVLQGKNTVLQCTVNSSCTINEFVENVWMPSQLNLRECRTSTIAFRSYLIKVILEYYNDRLLNEIRSEDIESYLVYLKNTYKTKRGTTLSQQTIKHHYCTLNLIFEYAVKLDYISVNPLNKVDTPKLVKHKVDALSQGEVVTFIKEIEKLPLMQRLMYTLLLTTGMRRGECFGLQWQDIDFENLALTIERNVTYTALNGITVGLPKTDMGIRTIPLTHNVVGLLAEYKAEEQEKYSVTNDSFVFHSLESADKPHEPTYLTKHMKRFMKRVGLPDMSPHDLRHTCASLMLQSGADIRSVQDILGQADASTTLNYYARSDMTSMRAATTRAFER